MPNTNAPSGFTPRKHGGGGVIRSNEYQIAGGLASNIYRGSFVIPVGTNKRIDVAAAGSRLLGVFQQVQFVDSNGEVKFDRRWASGQTLKTGTVALAQIYDDPDILFGAQVSGSAGLAAGDVGAIADIVIGTGNTASGQSGDMIDQATITSTVATGGQVRIEELDPIIGNDYGQYAKALCRINEGYLGGGSTTAGQANMPI